MQIREEVNFTKGRIIVRGKLVTRGKAKRADYILYYKPNIRSPSSRPKTITVDFGKGSTSFIYKIAVDTGSATRLTNAKIGEESRPAFPRDGKRIAYCYSPGNGAHSSIVIGNMDGSDLRPWSPSESNDFSPVFSPDNKTLVFSRSGFYGSYSPIAQPHPHAWRFDASDLDGTNVRVTASDGRRVENIMQVGLVRDFPKEKDAWHEVDKLGLTVRINEDPCVGRIQTDLNATLHEKCSV